MYDWFMDSLPKIEQYLLQLGLKPETTRIYLELLRRRPSVLQLAKAFGISRTQIYRHLEILSRYNLVSMEKFSQGTRYRALPLYNIEAIVLERQGVLQNLRANLASMTQLIQESVADKSQNPFVRHYSGLSGLKQANWNLTKARGEYRVFESQPLLHHFIDKDFVRRCNEELVKNKVISYDLVNYRPMLDDVMPIDLERAYYRYIDPKILKIDFEIYIYNETTTLLDYNPDNMHAIEIEHPILFRMMHQIYELIWELATPIELSAAESSDY